MINNFKKKFGNPEKVIIGFGDYEQYKQRKYKEPTKGKGFRDLFRKFGYTVLLVDEFRTSCKCSLCQDGSICETFRKCKNPRPWKTGSIIRHGLVRCKTCSTLWNRDTNASRNILKICENYKKGLERPEYLSRSKIISHTINIGMT